MRKTRQILLSLLWGTCAIALVMIILFETDILHQGILHENVKMEYGFSVVMELAALCAIPASIRLFRWKKVTDDLKNHGYQALLSWGLFRLSLLCIPLVLCVLFYYLFAQTSFCYLAIILGICLFFVYPSKERCAQDIAKE